MTEQTPDHRAALAALRRVETALCKREEAFSDWQRRRSFVSSKRKPQRELLAWENEGFAVLADAETELRAARWAACTLLTNQGA